MQNSWGEKWGEGGSFRLSIATARRLQLESLPVVADVVEDEHPEVARRSIESRTDLVVDKLCESVLDTQYWSWLCICITC